MCSVGDREPYITQKQVERFDLVEALFKKFNELIKSKRDEAGRVILDENATRGEKRKILVEYFDYRMSLDHLCTEYNGKEYSFPEFQRVVQSLFYDDTFPYSDADSILNSLDFFAGSFSWWDELLAYHLYRLSKDDESLSVLAITLGQYIFHTLSIEEDNVPSIPSGSISHDESISLLKRIIAYMDNYVEKNCTYLDAFKKAFETTEDDKSYSTALIIDRKAALYFAQEDGADQNFIRSRMAFEIISLNIRSFFIVLQVIDDIEELQVSKEVVWGRIDKWEELCNLFSINFAKHYFKEDKRLNFREISDKEAEKEEKRADEMEIFLRELAEKTPEEIMKSQKRIINYARTLTPDDDEALDQYTRIILEKYLCPAAKSDSVVSIKMMLNPTLNSCGLLKESIIDTLATAEFLYSHYATEYYAEQRFDYSCISALYYQAFEDAYNDLIWQKYAQWLNKKELDHEPYTSVLQSAWNKGYIEKEELAYGYLPSSKKDWKNYIDYDKDKKVTTVREFCMYGSFCRFLEKKESLPKFLNWFAKEIGFHNRYQMLECDEFMHLLNTFIEIMQNATEDRNRASHGGQKIELRQCKNDKKTVLDDLKEIKNQYLGLIQRLLKLFTFYKKKK